MSSFTADDYLMAAKERRVDISNVSNKKDSLVFTAYAAGVSVECILRHNIKKRTDSFDSCHDLRNLLIESQILVGLEYPIQKKILELIVQINQRWQNNLRYGSIKRTKRILAHELANKKQHIAQGILESYYTDIISKCEQFVKLGNQYGFAKTN